MGKKLLLKVFQGACVISDLSSPLWHVLPPSSQSVSPGLDYGDWGLSSLPSTTPSSLSPTSFTFKFSPELSCVVC